MQLHQALLTNASMLAFVMMTDPDSTNGRYFRVDEFLGEELQLGLDTQTDSGAEILSVCHEGTGEAVHFTTTDILHAIRLDTQPWGYPAWQTEKGPISLFVATPV